MHNEELKRLRKEKREAERKRAQELKQQEQDHLTSYINKDQFNFFYDVLKDMNSKMSSHNNVIDEIENKLLDINRKRQKRRVEKNNSTLLTVFKGSTNQIS